MLVECSRVKTAFSFYNDNDIVSRKIFYCVDFLLFVTSNILIFEILIMVLNFGQKYWNRPCLLFKDLGYNYPFGDKVPDSLDEEQNIWIPRKFRYIEKSIPKTFQYIYTKYMYQLSSDFNTK